MMQASRRTFIKGIGNMGVLAAALAAGLLKPVQVLAAEWRKSAFEAKDPASALKGLGATGETESKDIALTVPEIAENGLVVPVLVASNIPGTTSLSVLVEKNPNPLSAHFEFAAGVLPEARVNVKMGQTSKIKAVAKANGQFYFTEKEVKVTIGGCGG